MSTVAICAASRMSLARQVPNLGRPHRPRGARSRSRWPSPRSASGIATYLALTGAPPFGPHPGARPARCSTSIWCCCWRWRRWSPSGWSRSGPSAGAASPARGCRSGWSVLFSLIAVMPTIIVAVFSYLFFSFGIEAWFSDRVRTAISESVAVADAYLQGAPAGDPRRRAGDGERPQPRCRRRCQLNPQYLAPVLTAQAAMRGLTEAAVVRRQRHDAGAHRPRLRARLRAMSARTRCSRAAHGDVVIMTDDQDERVRALVRLDEFSDLYLYVGRFIEPRVLEHIATRPSCAAAQYEQLEGQRSGFQITFAVDLHPGGDAVPGRGGVDRHQFRRPAGRPDQPAGQRGRAGARRRSLGAGARGRRRTTNSLR